MFMYFCEKKYMKKLILSAAVLAMVFVGCKKEETKPSDSSTSSSSSSSTPKISKETTYSYNDSIITDTSITLYTYDSKGRLVSRINDYYSITYSYVSANLISTTVSEKSNGSVPNYTLNYLLDSKGKAIKSYQVGKIDTIQINYSTDGYSLGSSSSNSQFEVVGENIVKSNYFNYEYYLDKINVLSNANRGIYFMGKDSKNLVKSQKWVAVGSNPMSSTTQYTYEFDSKNRVIKSTRNTVTTNGLSGAGKWITKYEYIN